ncbi:unnamed protein product [Macrosiphum euphorbiae]|uniref:Uncharacterized protein n=1 Tax=Macrosiphum euphorbiae TaxID=13131 RepID=A0AAV0W0I5_9HEMI|nr:unnamed protein product [Macrosiphum euphorbiae]
MYRGGKGNGSCAAAAYIYTAGRRAPRSVIARPPPVQLSVPSSRVQPPLKQPSEQYSNYWSVGVKKKIRRFKFLFFRFRVAYPRQRYPSECNTIKQISSTYSSSSVVTATTGN